MARKPFHRSQQAGEQSPLCPESKAPGSNDKREHAGRRRSRGLSVGRKSGKEGHCLRSPGVWSSRDARGSFRAAGACPWLASALTAHGTASPAHHKGLCLGWHRWPGRTTVGRKRRKSASGKRRDTSLQLGSRGKPEAQRKGDRILTVRLRKCWSPSLSVSSLTGMALGMSCLLANTSSTASRSSSSCS